VVERASSLLHRPATELVSEETLAGMERDGWTPTQVRALIAGYRELSHRVVALEGTECQHCGIADRVRLVAAKLAKEARTARREKLVGHAGVVEEVVRVLREEVVRG
jgi:hypothetical protein